MQQDSSNEFLADLIEEEHVTRGPLEWWYGLAALPNVSLNASLDEREKVRRSRLTATILFSVLCIVTITFFVGLAIHNYIISAIMIGGVLSTTFCSFLNHKGFYSIAGILLILQVDGGQLMAFTHLPGGLDLAHMLLLDMLFVIGEIAAISFFPSAVMFLWAFFNCIILTLVLRFGPTTPALFQIATTSAGIQYYMDAVLVQGLVATIAFLWTRSINQAIERADRAHVIAALEHQIASQLQRIGEEKQQLEESIQSILDTHVRFANGDLDARVPLSEDNILWPLAGSLNMLLTRYRHNHLLFQNYQQIQMQAQEYQQMRKELQALIRSIQLAKRNSTPIPWVQHSALLDQLFIELNGNLLAPYSGSLPSHVKSTGPVSYQTGNLNSNSGQTPAYPTRNPQSNFGQTPTYPARNPQSNFGQTPTYPTRNPQSNFGQTPTYPTRNPNSNFGQTANQNENPNNGFGQASFPPDNMAGGLNARSNNPVSSSGQPTLIGEIEQQNSFDALFSQLKMKKPSSQK